MDLATALSLARETSRPKMLRVRCRAGLNGAKLTAMRIKLNSSAGFLPVSVRRELRASCRVSAFQVEIAVSLEIVSLSSSSNSDSESFFKNLLLTSISVSMRGSEKKYAVISRKSDKVLRRS